MKKSMVVVFNGPPGSGKSSSALHLKLALRSAGLTTSKMSFKDPLYNIAAAVYGVNVEWLKAQSSQELKNVPHHILKGKSQREVLVEVSENVIKPYYGQDYFGKLAAERMCFDTTNESCCYVFSDSGFEEELKPVSDKVEKDNTIIVRLMGRGEFVTKEVKDSRSYLSGDNAGLVLDFYNTRSLATLHGWLDNLAEFIVGDLG